MAKNMVLCKKGWLISQNTEDGSYVPFFVKVRSQDIVWDGTSGVNALINNEVNKGVNIISIEAGAKRKSTSLSGWRVISTGGREYTMSKAVLIGTHEFTLQDPTDLYTYIELPLKMRSDMEFAVSTTMNGLNDALALSHVNVLLDEDENKRYIHGVYVHLRNLIYQFPENFRNDKTFMESRIYITVSGNSAEG